MKNEKAVKKTKKIIIILLVIAILFSLFTMILSSSLGGFKLIKSETVYNTQGAKSSGNVELVIEPRTAGGG